MNNALATPGQFEDLLAIDQPPKRLADAHVCLPREVSGHVHLESEAVKTRNLDQENVVTHILRYLLDLGRRCAASLVKLTAPEGGLLGRPIREEQGLASIYVRKAL